MHTSHTHIYNTHPIQCHSRFNNLALSSLSLSLSRFWNHFEVERLSEDLEVIMSAFVFGFVLFLAMAASSDASYCMCNSGVSDSVLQKNIDYACGAGADCSAIMQNGACYNPNTVKDHCNYAVNSYYQRKNQASGSCDFQGTANVSLTGPTSVASGCVYQASPSSGGSTTPATPGGGTTFPGTTSGSLAPTGSGGFGTDNNNGVTVTLSSLPVLLVSLSLFLLVSTLI